MSFATDFTVGKRLMEQVNSSNTYFDKWKKRFRCQKLEDYYEGKQWDGDPNYEAYVFNLYYSTIDLKIPSLVFKEPVFQVSPKPSHYDFSPEISFEKALLATDTLNTLVSQDTMEFSKNIEMSLLDSFSYFGVIEVGYDATWKKNPNAGKPIIPADFDPEVMEAIAYEPDELPETERIFVKRIPAHRFRVGSNDCTELSKANWCGYWEYMRLADIKGKKSGFKNTSELEAEAQIVDEFIPEDSETEREQVGDLVKVWKLWHLRKKIFYIVCQSIVIFEEEFERLPLFGLRFGKRRKGWYPIPVSYNWKSPQDEMNETRQQLRTHRKRSRSIYTVAEGDYDDSELTKVTNGPDLNVVKSLRPGAKIEPVQPPTSDRAILDSLNWSRSDFDAIAGVSATYRPQNDRATATEIQDVAARASTREVREQEIVAKWLNEIANEILLQAIDKFTLPVWVKLNLDTTAEWGGEYQMIQDRWQKLTMDHFEGLQFGVTISAGTQSPISAQKETENYIKFVTFIQQFPMVGLHPSLIRESAYRLGYRNEKVIRHFMEMAQLAMVGQLEAAQQSLVAQTGNQVTGGSMQQKVSSQMEPPEMGQIQNQLIAQQGLGGPQ